MRAPGSDSPNARTRRTWAGCLPVAALVAAGAAAADSTFEPRISVGASYVDNIDLASPEEASDEEFVLLLLPGFKYDLQSPRLNINADYTLQALFYTGDSDRNESYNQFDGTATAALVQDYFFLEATGIATQQVIDPSRPVNGSDNIFDTGGNMSDAVTATLAPYFKHHFGQTIAEARYSQGFVNFSGEDSSGNILEDTQQRRVYASWETDPEQPQRFTWKAFYDAQQADYEISPTFRYDQANVELGYAVSRSIRLLATGGYESDLITDSTDGGLDEAFYGGGLELTLGQQHRLRAVAGHRFYGDSYEFAYHYDGRMLKLDGQYADGPMTAAQELALSPLSNNPNPGPISGHDLSRLSSEVYIRKYFNASARLVGRRTTIELRMTDYKRRYLSLDTQDHTTEVGLTFDRKLSSRTDLAAGATWRDFEGRDGESSKDMSYTLGFTRRMTASIIGTLKLSRVERTGNVSRYDVDWIMLSVQKTF